LLTATTTLRVCPGSVCLNADDPVRRKLKIAADLPTGQESGRIEVSRAIADCETRRKPKRAWAWDRKLTEFLIDEASTDVTA
jgi:phage terminase large subunit GpA-like protein